MQETERLNKVMSMEEAVKKFIHDGDVIGMGGQNVGRCPMAIVYEIVRQKKKNLTVVGCNLSISMDILVGAGSVCRTESGTGNVEKFGTTFMWRKGIQEGWLIHEDYSHLMMVSRFLAAELGLPFMPVMSGFGTDILKYSHSEKKYEIIENPWKKGEKVLLFPALSPDVSIIHVSKADKMGNVIIDGFTAHEPEMVRASKRVIVSCEEIISSDEVRNNPALTTIPYFYVNAVIEQPFGAYPTSVYKYYDYDNEHLNLYQGCAQKVLKNNDRSEYDKYLNDFVYGCKDFNEFLNKVTTTEQLKELKDRMRAICGGD